VTTIKDIAKLANVSKSTVSRVVSNNGFVKPETKERIERVIMELNYKPNVFAKGMRTNKSNSIGILFPDLSNPFFAEWYEILDKISREKGYLNYICISDPKGETEETRVNDLLARSIDGIILFSYTKNNPFWKRLEEINKTTPVICCDSMFQGFNVSCVYANGEKATKKAVEYIYNTGKRRIAYIKGSKDFDVVTNRFEGYKAALDELQIEFEGELVKEGKFTKNCGWKAAEKLMSLDKKPDAILASTDYMALGVLDYLTKNNYKIPGDVAVFGYDNLQLSAATTPPLSTIALPIRKLAETTINRLIELIENSGSEPEYHEFDCELKIRETT